MDRISLIPVGDPPAGLVAELAAFLEEELGHPCRVRGPALDPAGAFDPGRGQYNSRLLMGQLADLADGDDRMVLGVADVDLFSPLFTFVFGEAKLGGRVGIFSVHRLDPALYGLAPDPGLLAERSRKEALHESGHLLNLVHCMRTDCAMRFSGSAEEVDLKPDVFCPDCSGLARAGWAPATADETT